MIDNQNHRLVGYARVSTIEQELHLQIDALLAHGVKKEHLYCDKLSGAREDRPGLAAAHLLYKIGEVIERYGLPVPHGLHRSDMAELAEPTRQRTR